MMTRVSRPYLPVLGSTDPFAVCLAAESGNLTDEDRRILLGWRRKRIVATHRALWEAALSGTAKRLEEQYIARWARAHKCPEGVWRKNQEETTRKSRAGQYFAEAAEWLLENGYPTERLLDVAVERKYRNIKFPTPRQLYTEYVLEVMPEWIPPAERNSVDDGVSPNDLREATDEALRQRAGQRDPWAASELGMTGIDFSTLDQSWRKRT